MSATRFTALLLLALAAACTEEDTLRVGSRAVGQTCDRISDCKAGLTCRDGVCGEIDKVFDATTEGAMCASSAECGRARNAGLVDNRSAQMQTQSPDPDVCVCALLSSAWSPGSRIAR